jgi:hypothetical protein
MVGCSNGSATGHDRRKCKAGAFPASWCRRLGLIDCLREYRELASHSRNLPRQGDRRSHNPRR